MHKVEWFVAVPTLGQLSNPRTKVAGEEIDIDPKVLKVLLAW
jgi:hypothetical protein